MRVRYYREPNGDYLCANLDTRRGDSVDVRGAALEGSISSVCTNTATMGYLGTCKQVRPSRVPEKWRKAVAWT